MKIKITKKTLIKEGAFNWCFYEIHGRFINDDNTRYRKFKFIIDFDDNDLYEYFDDDNDKNISYDKKRKIYIDLLIDNFMYNCLPNNTKYNDIDKLQQFYDECNFSIKHYNDNFTQKHFVNQSY